MANGGVDIATLGLRLDGRQMKAEAASSEAALKGLGKAGSAVNSIMLQLGATLSAGIFLQQATRMAGEFQGAMQQSLSIMEDVSAALQGEMADAARQAGIEMNLGATKAAEAYFYLASAGFDAQQSIGAMGAVATFAKAGMFNMAQATDLATDAQSALGLTSKDAQENLKNLTSVTDVLVKANTLANASVEQFATSLTTEAGAALRSMGKDMEEGVAVLAAFADQGVKAQVAGTGLSRILRLMSSAAINNAEVYEQLGVEVFDASGEMANLADIVSDLEGALVPLADAERVAALEALGFQARVQGVILPLIGTSEKIREYEAALRDAGGTTKEVADKQMQAPFERLGKATKQITDGMIDLGNSILEKLIPAAELLAENIDLIKDAVIALTIAFGAAGLVKAVSAVVGVFKSFIALQTVSTFLSLVPAIKSVRDAMLLLQLSFGWIGLAIAGITAIASAVFIWRKRQREAAEAAREEAEAYQEKLNSLKELNNEQLQALQIELRRREILRAEIHSTQGQIMDPEDFAENTKQWDREKEMLEEINRLMRERQEIEGISTADAEAGRKRFELASKVADAMQVEIDKVEELNQAIGAEQKVIDLINLKYERRAALIQNASEYSGRELEIINAKTAALYDLKEQTIELQAAEDKKTAIEELNEFVAATEQAAETQINLMMAQVAGNEALNALKITLAGEAAVQQLESLAKEKNIKLTQDQISAVREAAEVTAQAAQEQERLTDAEKESERAKQEQERLASEKAKRLAEPYAEAARNIQNSFAGLFNDIFDDGLNGFEDFADNVLGIFKDLASNILATMLAKKYGITEMMDALNQGSSIGDALGSLTTGGPMGIAGLAIGGIGLLKGLFGGDDEERKRRDEMRNRLLKENAERLSEIKENLEGSVGIRAEEFEVSKDIAAAILKLGQQEGGWGKLGSYVTDTVSTHKLYDQFNDIFKSFGMSIQDFRKVVEASGIKLVDDNGRLIASALIQIQQAFEDMAETLRKEEEAFMTSLAIREAAAQGNDEFVASEQRRLEKEEQIRDAIARGFSDTALAELERIQILEDEAEALRKANDAAKERRGFLADLEAREAALAGDKKGEVTARLVEQQQQEIEAAEALVEAGIITEEMFQRLVAVLDGELAAAILAVGDAATQASTNFQEWEARIYDATGFTDMSSNIRNEMRRQDERAGLVAGGASDSFLEFIDLLHEEERASAQRAVDLQNTINSINSNLNATLTSLKSQEKTVRDGLAAELASINEQKEAIKANTAKFDDQIAAARSRLDMAQKQVDVAEEQLRVHEDQLKEQERLVAATRKVVDSLGAFSDELALSDASTLSPTRKLEEARRQYEALLAQARAGDADAAGQLPTVAKALLDASRAVNASNAGYASDYNYVTSTIEEIRGQFENQLTVEEAMLAELEKQTAGMQSQVDAANAAVDAAEAQLDSINAAKNQAEADARAQIAALDERAAAARQEANEIIADLRAQADAARVSAQEQIDAANAAAAAANQAAADALIEFLNIVRATEETADNTGETRDIFADGPIIIPPPDGGDPIDPPIDFTPIVDKIDEEMDLLQAGFNDLSERMRAVELAVNEVDDGIDRLGPGDVLPE